MFPINSSVFLVILGIVVLYFIGKKIKDRCEKKSRWHQAIDQAVERQNQDHQIF